MWTVRERDEFLERKMKLGRKKQCTSAGRGDRRRSKSKRKERERKREVDHSNYLDSCRGEDFHLTAEASSPFEFDFGIQGSFGLEELPDPAPRCSSSERGTIPNTGAAASGGTGSKESLSGSVHVQPCDSFSKAHPTEQSNSSWVKS